MRPFNLDEYLKDPSKKVVTRGGDTVKIHCTNYRDVKPIIAEIEGSGQLLSYSKDGSYFFNGESVRDLFFAPEKHEGWINIYKNVRDHYFGTFIYPRRADAEAVADSTCIATVKIEWEE